MKRAITITNMERGDICKLGKAHSESRTKSVTARTIQLPSMAKRKLKFTEQLCKLPESFKSWNLINCCALS